MPVEPTPAPVRATNEADFDEAKPLYAVWELTMHCDQPCQHCGSRAGTMRPDELSTAEAMEVVASLVRLGCREIALIGGEAYLRPDVLEIVSALARGGIRVVMQTGGRAFTRERARAFRDAGLTGVGVSIDGPREVHDELRGNRGSFDAAMAALDHAAEAGMIITANTQINRLNWRHLEALAAELQAKGAQTWQVQLTVPMGRAADRPDWIIEPWRVVDVIDILARIQREAIARCPPGQIPFNVFPNNNIGYFGPHEELLRSRPGGESTHWMGCLAGILTVGIESNGNVKGCPSLPSAPYVGGNVRDLSFDEIWAHSSVVRFSRDRELDELWGFCKTCYYAEACRAGCSWTAHCTLGRRGNNPFCYHRVTQLRREGLRERLVAKERAPGEPYDYGRLALELEPWRDEEGDGVPDGGAHEGATTSSGEHDSAAPAASLNADAADGRRRRLPVMGS